MYIHLHTRTAYLQTMYIHTDSLYVPLLITWVELIRLNFLRKSEWKTHLNNLPSHSPLKFSKPLFPCLKYKGDTSKFRSSLTGSKAGVGKLWPLVQMWSTAYFYMAHKFRMDFTFFKWLKKRERIFHDIWKLPEIQISVICK